VLDHLTLICGQRKCFSDRDLLFTKAPLFCGKMEKWDFEKNKKKIKKQENVLMGSILLRAKKNCRERLVAVVRRVARWFVF
jgi:hypothetical protein